MSSRTGGPSPGGFKGGVAEAGSNPHAVRYPNIDGKRIGDGAPDYQVAGGIAERSTRQIDTSGDGQNRAHVNGGRDEAMRISRKTGGMHPSEHAGWAGKGRW